MYVLERVCCVPPSKDAYVRKVERKDGYVRKVD